MKLKSKFSYDCAFSRNRKYGDKKTHKPLFWGRRKYVNYNQKLMTTLYLPKKP